MIDVRFTTAVQIALSLGDAELRGQTVMSSIELSETVNSSPIYIRRLLRPLVRSKLVVAVPGRTGGLRLGRSAEQITLLDVHTSVIGDRPLWPARQHLPRRCVVTRNIDTLLEAINADSGDAVKAQLAVVTLAACLGTLRRLDEHRARRSRRS